MASSFVTVVLLLTVSSCLLQVESNCVITGQGRVTSFSDEGSVIKLPCKYWATTIICQGYHIHVSPRHEYDCNFNLYMHSIWVSIKKGDDCWIGKTNMAILNRHFRNASLAPFRTMNGSVESVNTEMIGDSGDETAKLENRNDSFSIVFSSYSFNTGDKDIRDKNGVEITCPDAENMARTQYPESVCGNASDKGAVRSRKRVLKLMSKSEVVIYDILENDKIKQKNPDCDLAVKVFKNCTDDEKRKAVKSCSKFVTDKYIVDRVKRNSQKPMVMFVQCLKCECTDVTSSCEDIASYI